MKSLDFISGPAKMFIVMFTASENYRAEAHENVLQMNKDE